MRKSLDQESKDQIDNFLQAFSLLHHDIREQIIYRISPYNTLLSLQATTFDDFAYRVAQKDNSNSVIMPLCPLCKKFENVTKNNNKDNYYTCNVCNHSFFPKPITIIRNTKCDALKWMKFLHCLLAGNTVEETMKQCDIYPNTYYNMRNRLTYAMSLMMQEVKLYGVIQCDNLFEHISFKGSGLTEPDFDYGYPVQGRIFIPRPPKKRGGPCSDLNMNSVSVFLAIDNHGHCAVRYATIGKPKYTDLMRAIPPSKYLLQIPDEDPFKYTLRTNTDEENVGPDSLLVSDKEGAIIKYAEQFEIKHEAHVFYDGKRYLSLPKGAHNIQRANWLCSYLNTFFAKHGYVSSRYLPAMLVLFEFIYNTGATTEAIGRLFEILVTPGYGLGNAEDYAQLYTTPNYILESSRDDKIFSRIEPKKLLGAYLYYLKHTKGENITNNQILEATGYSKIEPVKNMHNQILASGMMEVLCKKMSEGMKITTDKVRAPKKRKNRHLDACLIIYTNYCKNLMLPLDQQEPKKKFVAEQQRKLNTTMTYETVTSWFDRIEDRGLSTFKLSELELQNKQKKLKSPFSKSKKLYLDILVARLEYEKEYREKYHTKPLMKQIYAAIAPGFKMEPSSMANTLSRARNFPEYDEIIKKYDFMNKED